MIALDSSVSKSAFIHILITTKCLDSTSLFVSHESMQQYRMSKLSASGVALGVEAHARLIDLSKTNPEWQLAANERDEFSYWMIGTGDPDFESKREIDIAPRKRRELVPWLKKPPPGERPFYEDTWREVCRTRFFHSLYGKASCGRLVCTRLC